jgi:hypothetical protein
VIYHLVKKYLPDVKVVVATEMFNPDNAKLIATIPNKTIFAPIMSFDEIIVKHGFPMLSKELSQKVNAVRNCKTLGK